MMTERLLYLFFAGSVFGWGLETIYRRFSRNNKTRKWINPGFLVGPYLPLYGFGVCILFLLAEFEEVIHIGNVFVLKAVVLLLMAGCMTVLELIAGIIFIQGMNLKLWDYSNKPFNYKGIICLEFSLYWLVLAAIYYMFLHPFITDFTNVFLKNQAFLYPLGVISGVFAVDFGYSIQIAAKIKKFAADNDILVRYEELKSNIRKHAEEHRDKYLFMFAFHSKTTLSEHLKKYLEASPKINKIRKIVNQSKNREEI